MLKTKIQILKKVNNKDTVLYEVKTETKAKSEVKLFKDKGYFYKVMKRKCLIQ